MTLSFSRRRTSMSLSEHHAEHQACRADHSIAARSAIGRARRTERIKTSWRCCQRQSQLSDDAISAAVLRGVEVLVGQLVEHLRRRDARVEGEETDAHRASELFVVDEKARRL